MVVRDANAYLPGDYIYNPGAAPTILRAAARTQTSASCDQYFPEAVFNENQMIVNLNARFTPNSA